MGTPDFAVESLRRLVEGGCDVVAVVTMPDKPVGRHHDVLQASPVKQYAEAHAIPVLQPTRLKDETFLETLRSLRADLQVVVAFRMLPEVVWAMPPLGTFNLHAALLPQYRGAAPINWAVINGDTETGVTTFFLDYDIDTGNIIHRKAVPLNDTDTAGDVHDRLMTLGADLVLQTVREIAAADIHPVEQGTILTPSTPLHPAPKLFRENTQICWTAHTVKSAYDFIRGLAPYPGAWTTLRTADGKETVLKVFFAAKEYAKPEEPVGTLLTDNRQYIKVTLPDGYLSLTDLQLAGKRRMSAADFLRGARLEGARLVELSADVS